MAGNYLGVGRGCLGGIYMPFKGYSEACQTTIRNELEWIKGRLGMTKWQTKKAYEKRNIFDEV